MKRKFINEDSVEDSLGKLAFADEDTFYGDDFLSMQKAKKDKDGNYIYEPNTEIENILLKLLDNWTKVPSLASEQLIKYKKLFKLASVKFPKIFKPKTAAGTIVYRGLTKLSPDIVQNLQKVSAKNWVSIGNNYMLCKIAINYNPNRSIQSWTPSRSVAERFADEAILVTKQDEDFLINQDVLEMFYGENENEILHFGESYANKVYIVVKTNAFYNKKIQPKNVDITKAAGGIGDAIKAIKTNVS